MTSDASKILDVRCTGASLPGGQGSLFPSASAHPKLIAIFQPLAPSHLRHRLSPGNIHRFGCLKSFMWRKTHSTPDPDFRPRLRQSVINRPVHLPWIGFDRYFPGKPILFGETRNPATNSSSAADKALTIPHLCSVPPEYAARGMRAIRHMAPVWR